MAKKTLLILALGVCLMMTACPFMNCVAQTVTPPQYPDQVIGFGASYNPNVTTPQAAFTGFYAKNASQTAGTYAYSAVDITSLQWFTRDSSGKLHLSFVPLTSFSAGIFQHIKDFGPFHIYTIAATGGSFGGNLAGWNYAIGGGVPFSLGKGWHIMPTARCLKATISNFQGIYSLIFTWGK